MVISTTTLRGGPYSGNGSTTAFSTGFSFASNSDVEVILYNSSGTPTVQTITTHYTLAGAGTGSAGTVTMVTAPASGETLVIRLNVALTQSQDYVNNAKFPNELTEAAIDKLTRIVQQQEEKLDRVLKFTGIGTISDLEIPVPEAGKALVGNSGGTGYENATITAGSSVVILDEDDMSSDSATGVPSQQSTKAYVDLKQDLISGDTLTSATVATGDKVLIQDADDSDNLKTVTASSIADLGGGGTSYLSSTSLTGSSVDIALPAGYVGYKLIIISSVDSASAAILGRVSTDGASFDSGASDYTRSTGSASSSFIIGESTSSSPTNNSFTKCEIWGARDSATRTYTNSTNVVSTATAMTINYNNIVCARVAYQVDTHIRLLTASGTFSSGTAYLWGFSSS